MTFNRGADYYNRYRSLYSTMTEGELAEWHEELYASNPCQSHFNILAALKCFDDAATVAHVVEVGGWDGALAAQILSQRDDIESWTNHELCKTVVDLPACTDPRYTAVHSKLVEPPPSDVLVASHVIEHMSAPEVERLLDATTATTLYIDVPALQKDWTGSSSFHVLSWSGPELWAEVEKRGFVLLDYNGGARWWKR